MLLRFQASNHRSILNPVELSLIAVDTDRGAARSFDRLSEQVLTVAGIYGPNASGKSNVLDALSWLSAAVATSLLGWDEGIPRDAHRFGKGPRTPSAFDLDLVVDGVRFSYQLELDDSAVLYESLYSYPERRRRTLFERSENEIEFRRGLEGASGIRRLLTPTTLAISAGMRLGDTQLSDAGRAIARTSVLGLRPPQGSRHLLPRAGLPYTTRRLFLEDLGSIHERVLDLPERRIAALNLLRMADPEIDDVQVYEMTEQFSERSRRELRFIRSADDEFVPLDFEEESAGTQTWFHLLGPALGVLAAGTILLIDEIDASLHPRLSAQFLGLFQDPQTNPRGAQLIFASHDTSLLNVLNRDEVWLTEKEPGVATRLVALAEFGGERVRKSVNLERAYLQGRFGAVPEVDQTDMRRAVRHVLNYS